MVAPKGHRVSHSERGSLPLMEAVGPQGTWTDTGGNRERNCWRPAAWGQDCLPSRHSARAPGTLLCCSSRVSARTSWHYSVGNGSGRVTGGCGQKACCVWQYEQAIAQTLSGDTAMPAAVGDGPASDTTP